MKAINRVRPILCRNAPASRTKILKASTTSGNHDNIIIVQPVSMISSVISQQKFHSSIRSISTQNNAPTGKRVRRRRDRRSLMQPMNDETIRVSNNGHSDPTFISAARNFLTRTEKALEPMKRTNDIFIIKRDSNEQGDNLILRLKPGEGNYILQVDEEMLTLTLISPMSGTYTYVLCPQTGSFIGMDDGHIAEGMIVRDLIRHCTGMPQF